MIVRLSRGSFDPAKTHEIEDRLRRSGETLIPAIRRLAGCVGYHAAVTTGSMVNVSLWNTLDDAKQMDSLTEMQALAKEFIALGVQFERPIINYDTVWSL